MTIKLNLIIYASLAIFPYFSSSKYLELNFKILVGSKSVYCINYRSHYWIAKSVLQKTIVLFLIVVVATMPTNVLPAPQGSTTTPDLAFPPINTLESAFS